MFFSVDGDSFCFNLLFFGSVYHLMGPVRAAINLPCLSCFLFLFFFCRVYRGIFACTVCCCSVFMSDTKPWWRESGSAVVSAANERIRTCLNAHHFMIRKSCDQTLSISGWRRRRHRAADAVSYCFLYLLFFFALPAACFTIALIENVLLSCDHFKVDWVHVIKICL